MTFTKKSLFLGALMVVSLFWSSVAFAQSEADFNKMMKLFLGTTEGREAIAEALQQYAKDQQAKRTEERRQLLSGANVVGDSPFKGPKDAKVTILEFSDFQCPYCKRAAATADKVVEEYPKDVKLVFKHLPLSFHKEALPAAKASMAAAKQGKFWEMHDALFDGQKKLGSEYYPEAAKEIGLDVEKFKKDMASPEVDKMVKADMELARKLGVNGTPGFFVNGEALQGARPFADFKKAVDRALQG